MAAATLLKEWRFHAKRHSEGMDQLTVFLFCSVDAYVFRLISPDMGPLTRARGFRAVKL